MLRFVPAFGLMLLTAPALAHTGGDAGASLFAGVLHPLSGLDHLLAMVAVGLWATQSGGRTAWLLPIVFPLAMALGAVAGAAGLAVTAGEVGVALSVLLLGVLIGFAVRLPVAGGAGLVALFAALHGHAHGAELPASADPIVYAMGFMAATAALHLAGIAIGTVLNAAPVRGLGAATAAAGVVLIATL